MSIGPQSVSILLVEDNAADARLVVEMFRDAAADGIFPLSYEVIRAERLSQALSLLEGAAYDVILIDLNLPDSHGLETFTSVHQKAPGAPVVVLTGLSDEAMGIRAVAEGAQDYLVKGEVDSGILARSIRFAIERHKGLRPHKIGAPEPYAPVKGPSVEGSAFQEMVGTSRCFKEALGLAQMVARTSRTSVLIIGETGTGKELIANSIHYSSSRKEGPFIKLNCSAIPDSLLEAEMFGYEKGAFTDARQMKKGLFEVADGGTIFLDEIGDMDARLQPKLLQILENRSFRRVGGTRDITVDVRVVAATNKDLELMVKERRFREDLYYRLKVMVISLPSLRQRHEDIIPLAQGFIAENCRSLGCGLKRLSDDGRESLMRYPWPGNIRELRNAIERAVLIAPTDEILPVHLPSELRSDAQGIAPQDLFSSVMSLDEMERSYVRFILDKVGGNKTRAAEILGISRLTLREKIKMQGEQG